MFYLTDMLNYVFFNLPALEFMHRLFHLSPVLYKSLLLPFSSVCELLFTVRNYETVCIWLWTAFISPWTENSLSPWVRSVSFLLRQPASLSSLRLRLSFCDVTYFRDSHWCRFAFLELSLAVKIELSPVIGRGQHNNNIAVQLFGIVSVIVTFLKHGWCASKLRANMLQYSQLFCHNSHLIW